MSTGVALLGAGLFAREAHLPALARLPDAAVLVAVYSRSLASAQALADDAKAALGAAPAVYHDADPAANLDALLARADIAAVIVALPITTQPTVIRKALAAGKHVLSEKPVAKDVADGIALIREYEAAYKPKGLVWRVAENFEAEPGYRLAGKLVAEGKIGKVCFFRLQAINHLSKDSKWYQTPWRTIPDYQGGFVMDGGVHSVALIRTVLPGTLTHVSSFSSLNKPYLHPIDTIQVILKSSDGSHGILDLSFAAPSPSRSPIGSGLIITGSSGYLELLGSTPSSKDPTKNVVQIKVTVVKQDEDGRVLDEKVEVYEEEPRGVYAEIASFLGAVKGEGDGIGEPRRALADVAVIQAALNSEGHLVDLQKLVEG